MNTLSDSEQLTIQKTADVLGVSTKTLRRWEKKGILIPGRTAGNQRRYSRADIRAFQSAHKPDGVSMNRTEGAVSDAPVAPSPSSHMLGEYSMMVLGIPLSDLKRFFSGRTMVIGAFALAFLVTASAFAGSLLGKRNTGDQRVLGLTHEEQESFRLFDGLPAGTVLAAADDSRNYTIRMNVPTVLSQGMTVEGGATVQGDMTIHGSISADNLSAFISGVTAGEGIAVTSGALPTITNSGVLSLGGKTGAVALTAGSGISIDGTKISNTYTAPAVNSFETINVDGTAVKSGANDTLYLVSGTGITLSTSGKYITITNSLESPLTVAKGGTGFASYAVGDMLYASGATALSKIAIGGAGQALIIEGGVPTWKNISGDVCTNCIVTNPSANQTITPSADATGLIIKGANGGVSDLFKIQNNGATETYLTVSSAGNLTLGNSSSNTVAFASRVGSNMVPVTGSQYDIGASDRRWKTIYGDTANFTNFSTDHATINGTTAEDFLLNTDYTGDDGQSSTLSFERGAPAVNAQLKWNGSDVSGINRLFSFNAGLYINPDTGIYSSGKASLIVNQPFSEDIFTASASSQTKFVIKNSGNVGIGTTNPQYPLDVSGTVNATALSIGGTAITSSATELNMLDGATVTSGGVLFGNGTYMTQDSGNFFWDDTNNRLGVGTTAPLAYLHSQGTSEQLRLGYDASNYASFTIGSDGTLTLSDTGNTIATLSDVNASFAVPTQFTAAGNVDIAYDLILSNQTISNITSYGPLQMTAGESFENNNLTFKTYGTGNIVADLSGTGGFWLNGTDTSIIFDTKTATDTDYWMGIIDDAGGDDDDLFVIGDGTTPGTNPFLTINTSGNVGIGTTNPANKVSVRTNTQYDGLVVNNGTNNIGWITGQSAGNDDGQLALASSGTTKVVLNSNANSYFTGGNVGIGTTGPGYKLQVQVDGATEGHVAADGTWANTSDARLKTNVLTLNSGLGTILGLRPVTYNSITDPTGEATGLRVGFVAQEVEELFPMAVDTDPVTGYKSISYTKFVPLLTKSIQEVASTLTSQGDSLQDMKEDIASLSGQQKTPLSESSLTGLQTGTQSPNLSSIITIASSSAEYNVASLSGTTLSDALPTNCHPEQSEGSRDSSASGLRMTSDCVSPANSAFSELFLQEMVGRPIASWLTDLVVDGYALFKKSVVFAGTVLFQSPVSFAREVFFGGHVTVGKDTAGIAVISQFTDTVLVKFETPYANPPIVSISLTTQSATDSASFLDEGHNAVVTDVTTTGFSVHLSESAMRDYEYNWVAVSVKEPVVTRSSSHMSEVMGESIATSSAETTTQVE